MPVFLYGKCIHFFQRALRCALQLLFDRIDSGITTTTPIEDIKREHEKVQSEKKAKEDETKNTSGNIGESEKDKDTTIDIEHNEVDEKPQSKQ